VEATLKTITTTCKTKQKWLEKAARLPTEGDEIRLIVYNDMLKKRPTERF
jgi:hypothetical protein